MPDRYDTIQAAVQLHFYHSLCQIFENKVSHDAITGAGLTRISPSVACPALHRMLLRTNSRQRSKNL
jgi:hypothetical protein